jgi:hypothetical protein
MFQFIRNTASGVPRRKRYGLRFMKTASALFLKVLRNLPYVRLTRQSPDIPTEAARMSQGRLLAVGNPARLIEGFLGELHKELIPDYSCAI